MTASPYSGLAVDQANVVGSVLREWSIGGLPQRLNFVNAVEIHFLAQDNHAIIIIKDLNTVNLVLEADRFDDLALNLVLRCSLCPVYLQEILL